MAWHIHEIEVLRANQLDGRSFEQTKVVLANVSSILDRFPCDLMDIRLGADDSDCEKGEVSRRSGSSSAQDGSRTVILRTEGQ